jgi:hypothetical protein
MIEIKTGDIPCCVYVSTILNHTHTKNIILDCIKNFGIFGINPGVGYRGQHIFNTDWHLSKALTFLDPVYCSVVRPIIDNHNEALTQYLGYDEPIKCDNVWFQQYQKEDYHWWHRHSESIFSNIYYVDLPEGTSKTSFRFLGKEFQIEIEEGQILTFPSFIEHCSKPNLSNKIKTVISFNSN